ncbi:MAG: hypothetical protein GEU74_04815 [Nitriliruptorales bacterium]|nr:hypothetical protein [Nitriliruptorales bacterium]
MLIRLAATVAGLVLAAGCASRPPAAAPSGPDAQSEAAAALPACGKPPSPAPDAPPGGAVIPPRTRLTAVRENPPLAQLNGYIESTPAEVRQWVDSQEELTVEQAHATNHESQLLVSDGEHTVFIRLSAVCDNALLLAEVIAPSDEAAALPTPAGGSPAS